jgi:hypothetical protein
MVLDIPRAAKVMCVLRKYADRCPGTTTITHIECKVRAKIIEVGERAGIMKRLPNKGDRRQSLVVVPYLAIGGYHNDIN